MMPLATRAALRGCRVVRGRGARHPRRIGVISRARCCAIVVALLAAVPHVAGGRTVIMNNGTSAATSRLTIPPPEEMDPAQRCVYEQALAYFGAPIGPRMALIETPEVAVAWSNLVTQLQKSALPKRIWELTILLVAREWDSQFEWWAHEEPARRAGLTESVIEAIRSAKKPAFAQADEAATYDYVTELLRDRRVSQPSYDRLRDILGSRQLVELTVLIGHYSSVAMTLAAYEVRLPLGVAPPMPALADR